MNFSSIYMLIFPGGNKTSLDILNLTFTQFTFNNMGTINQKYEFFKNIKTFPGWKQDVIELLELDF